jgi:hypothetical protein
MRSVGRPLDASPPQTRPQRTSTQVGRTYHLKRHVKQRKRLQRARRCSLCVPSANSMYVFPPSTTMRGGTLRSSDPDPDPDLPFSLSSSSSSPSSSSSSLFPKRAVAGGFLPLRLAASRPRLRIMAQSSCICERGTTSSCAPPSMSTGIPGGSLGACRVVRYVSPTTPFHTATGFLLYLEI